MGPMRDKAYGVVLEDFLLIQSNML